MTIGLSDLSATEFLTLARMGFYPRGLVVGVSFYDAGLPGRSGWTQTSEVTGLGTAMRVARSNAIVRMRAQAKRLGAEGIVGVRLHVEHHVWHGGRHNVVQIRAIGTAIAFDRSDAPLELRGSPSLSLDGEPFTSDLSGQDFVLLLRAGYRPVELAIGNCVYGVSSSLLGMMQGNVEMTSYTRAFQEARERAMSRLEHDLVEAFKNTPAHRPVGIVGMTVEEKAHAGAADLIEFTAIGTAVALLAPDDPRRAPTLPAPRVVVPLDA